MREQEVSNVITSLSLSQGFLPEVVVEIHHLQLECAISGLLALSKSLFLVIRAEENGGNEDRTDKRSFLLKWQ